MLKTTQLDSVISLLHGLPEQAPIMQEFIDSSGLDGNMFLQLYSKDTFAQSLEALSPYSLPPVIFNNIATLFGE